MAATATVAARAARQLGLTGWIIAIPALGALASLAGNNPAAPPGRAEAAPHQITRAENAPAPALAMRQAPAPAPPLATGVRLDNAPPRETTGLELIRNGWIYNCMECHTLLRAQWRYDRPLNEHQGIHLEHGNNRFCLNCHHPTNRNAFVDYDGTEFAQDDIVQLCAKCHGTTFRDWQAGVHGRQNGYWNVQAGAKTRLRCIQCHDPHRPKFPDMKPLAPLRYPPRAANQPAA
jgi:hypothetical protein